MRCHICDRVLDEPQYNADLEGYEPCDTCLAVINDTVKSFQDVVYLEEDQLWQEPAHDLGHGIDADEDEDIIDEPD